MTDGPKAALTVYTDASFAHNKRAGSWGAVIRGDGVDAELSGSFRAACTDSTLAELQAIGNAVHEVGAREFAPAGAHCILYSDCQTVVSVLNGKGRFRRASDQQAALEFVREIIGRSGLVWTFLWVESHQASDSDCPHAIGNRRADRLARDANKALGKRKELRRRYRRRRRERKRAEALARDAHAREERFQHNMAQLAAEMAEVRP